MTETKYEYQILTRRRYWYGPEHYSVKAGDRVVGWSEWSAWHPLVTNRGSGYPYPTEIGARRVMARFHTVRSVGHRSYQAETECRLQRRPVVDTWEDVPCAV